MTAPQPRKQARQARARITCQAILEAAARILETDGPGALTTNAIAVRAGVSIGSLYQYFPNKEAILATLIRDKRHELLQGMRETTARAAQMPAEQAIDALIRAGMVHQVTRPRLALELEALEPHLALEQETRALAAEMAGLIVPTIRRINPMATPAEAQDVIAICKGLMHANSHTGRADKDPHAESLFAKCLRAVLGYLHHPDPHPS